MSDGTRPFASGEIIGGELTGERPLSEEIANHPTWTRLNEELDWYDRSSRRNQRGYKATKTAQIILAASIPVVALAGATWSAWGAAILGAIVAALEGIQQLWKSDTLWIEYRSTAERLQQEKHLFLALSGPYRNLEIDEALKLLAEQVEGHVSAEHTRWVEAITPAKKEE
jgi:hypothetical protein